MRRIQLGDASLVLSRLALGGGAWGAELDEASAHRLLDIAADAGLNLIDTAECYPIPFSAGTYGSSERIVGSWVRQRRASARIVVATKVLGRGHDFPWVRSGKQELDRTNLEAALEASLRRLQVDAIDIYQLHWPSRQPLSDGAPNETDDLGVPLEETMAVLADMRKAGKIRSYGVCNETQWGVRRQLLLAARNGWPRPVSIQNRYNLLERSSEKELAEIAQRESVPLLAYSPLAHGTLSGKYGPGAPPPDSRYSKYPFFKRYRNRRAHAAATSYLKIANLAGLTPIQMALAFVISRPFVVSAIIGVSNEVQLHEALAAQDCRLTADTIQAIERQHSIDAQDVDEMTADPHGAAV